jgi:hypothetical protein
MYRNEHPDGDDWTLGLLIGVIMYRYSQHYLDDPTPLILQEEADRIKGSIKILV